MYCREDGVEVYHKADLARACADVFGFDEAGLLWLLFRGARGHNDGQVAIRTLQQLVDRFDQVFQDKDKEKEKELEWVTLNLPGVDDAWRPLGLDRELFRMFRSSPVDCTPEFATRFHLVHGETRAALQAVFAHNNSPVNQVPAPLRALHRDVVQGGEEWCALQLLYNAHSIDKTPSPSSSKDNSHPLGFAAHNYCVVRGYVLEALACEALARVHSYGRVLQLGMLVDETTREAISPDLIVCNDGDGDKNSVIVYEIKGVFGAKHSSHYQRAMWLATRQLKRAAQMIRRTGLKVVCRLVIVYVTDTGTLHTEETQLDAL